LRRSEPALKACTSFATESFLSSTFINETPWLRLRRLTHKLRVKPGKP
jgi:hypothetical protein